MRYGTYYQSWGCPPGGVLLLGLAKTHGLAGESRDLFLGLAGDKSIFFGRFVHNREWIVRVEKRPNSDHCSIIHHRLLMATDNTASQLEQRAVRTSRHSVDVSTAILPTSFIRKFIMSVATSAIASPVLVSEADTSTLFDIGFQSTKAEQAMEQGKARLDTLDANLFDFIKSASYDVFMKIREVLITGAVDAGRTADAAQKQFERQIGRISANFTIENEQGVKVAYKKPVAESKDAKRKAEARAAEIKRLEKFEDGELLDVKAELLRKGDNKSLNEVKKINAEVTRRNADVIAEQKAEVKAIVEKLNARIKELVKDNDIDSLTAGLLAME